MRRLICSRCLKRRLEKFFHKNKRSKTGRVHYCKDCISILFKEKYYNDRDFRIKRNLSTRSWCRENPDKVRKINQRNKESMRKHDRKRKGSLEVRVRDKVRGRISRGKIERKPCYICGKPKGQAHHEDYTKPLQVVFLCSAHHAAWHRLFKIRRTV